MVKENNILNQKMKQITFILFSLLIVVSCKPTTMELKAHYLEEELTKGFTDILGYFIDLNYKIIINK